MSAKIRYREVEEIQQVADGFRALPSLQGHHLPPLDVIYIAEVILKLDIIPIEDLFVTQKIDAALLPDLSGFYIDEDAYLSWEKGNRWVENRLRFSFAHELGHYLLHQEAIVAGRFARVEEFKAWAGERSHCSSAEFQADEFAGRLLVPRPALLAEYDGYRQQAEAADAAWRAVEGMRQHIARKIAPRFGVNHQVIEVRFDREGIWPAE